MAQITQDFNTEAGTEAFMKERDIDLDGLINLVDGGRFGNNPRAKQAKLYIERKQREKRTQGENDAYDLNVRAVEAQERATTATEWSARSAFAATVVSIIALIVSIAAYFKAAP